MKETNNYRALLTRKEAAHRLSLSESTLAKWACIGRPNLPFYLIGGRARYDELELERFIESNRIGQRGVRSNRVKHG